MLLDVIIGSGDPVRAAAGFVRLLTTVGAVGLVGSVLFLVVLSDKLTADEAKAARRAVIWFAVVLVAAMLASLPVQAITMARGPEGIGRGELYSAMMRARFGDAFLIRLGGLLLCLFALRRATWGAAFAAIGAVMVAASFAATGHATQYRPRQELAALVTLHVLAGGFWFASLFLLRPVTRRRDPRSAAEAIGAWSRWGVIFAVLAIASGLGAAFLLNGPMTTLPAGWFGRILLAKAALVAILVVFALVNRFRTTRLMARGDSMAATALDRALGRDRWIALIILWLTAELAGATPPDLGHRLLG